MFQVGGGATWHEPVPETFSLFSSVQIEWFSRKQNAAKRARRKYMYRKFTEVNLYSRNRSNLRKETVKNQIKRSRSRPEKQIPNIEAQGKPDHANK